MATTRWQDWASFTLGLWLAMSPWLLGYSHEEAATANAAFVGLALALGAHYELSFESLSAEWLNVSAGAWLVCAPFILGYGNAYAATGNSLAVGSLIMVLAGSAMSIDKEIGKWWHRRVAGH